MMAGTGAGTSADSGMSSATLAMLVPNGISSNPNNFNGMNNNVGMNTDQNNLGVFSQPANTNFSPQLW